MKRQRRRAPRTQPRVRKRDRRGGARCCGTGSPLTARLCLSPAGDGGSGAFPGQTPCPEVGVSPRRGQGERWGWGPAACRCVRPQRPRPQDVEERLEPGAEAVPTTGSPTEPSTTPSWEQEEPDVTAEREPHLDTLRAGQTGSTPGPCRCHRGTGAPCRSPSPPQDHQRRRGAAPAATTTPRGCGGGRSPSPVPGPPLRGLPCTGGRRTAVTRTGSAPASTCWARWRWRLWPCCSSPVSHGPGVGLGGRMGSPVSPSLSLPLPRGLLRPGRR